MILESDIPLEHKYQVLNSLLIGVKSESKGEAVPQYMRDIISAFESDATFPICFVLAKRGEIARFSSILYALYKIQNDTPAAFVTFRQGDRVLLHPERRVYIFDQVDKLNPTVFWLSTLDNDGRRTLPIKHLYRLEHTTLQRPKGRINKSIWNPLAAPLDILLGTSTYGNQSVFKNKVIILDSLSGFSEFTEHYSISHRDHDRDYFPLNKLLPFGELYANEVTGKSQLKKRDERNPTGEPVIAVTNSCELLANYCIEQNPRSRVIVANGLSRLKNLQAFDEIAETQNLVLFASHDEQDMLESINRRRTKFWWLGYSEIRSQSPDIKKGLTGALAHIERYAYNHSELKLETILCNNPCLEEMYVGLRLLSDHAAERSNDQFLMLLKSAWNFFIKLCGRITDLTVEDSEQLVEWCGRTENEVHNHSAWLTKKAYEDFLKTICTIRQFSSGNGNIGEAKARVISAILDQNTVGHLRWAVLCRSERDVRLMQQWLASLGYPSGEVFSSRTLPEDRFYDLILCPSWLGSDRMMLMAKKLVTPRIVVVGYPFEAMWGEQFQRFLNQRINLSYLSVKEKSRITGVGDKNADETEENPVVKICEAAGTDLNILELERKLREIRKAPRLGSELGPEKVTAVYVGFQGDGYTFLTKSHKIPVATALIAGNNGKIGKIPELIIADIGVGDYLVFPESGDRELIQEVADKLIGGPAAEYRTFAHMWKEALWRSNISENRFMRLAKELGQPRHIATIRNWLADTSQIGPQTRDDLALISLVTDDEALRKNERRIWEAIVILRGYHQSAGNRLRDVLLEQLPSGLGEIEENGSRVDLGEYGGAWIVQVDSISPEEEERLPSEVNRLHWSEDGTALPGLFGNG